MNFLKMRRFCENQFYVDFSFPFNAVLLWLEIGNFHKLFLSAHVISADAIIGSVTTSILNIIEKEDTTELQNALQDFKTSNNDFNICQFILRIYNKQIEWINRIILASLFSPLFLNIREVQCVNIKQNLFHFQSISISHTRGWQDWHFFKSGFMQISCTSKKDFQ